MSEDRMQRALSGGKKSAGSVTSKTKNQPQKSATKKPEAKKATPKPAADKGPTVKELKAEAKALKVTGYTKMGKPELIEAIAKAKETPREAKVEEKAPQDKGEPVDQKEEVLAEAPAKAAYTVKMDPRIHTIVKTFAPFLGTDISGYIEACVKKDLESRETELGTVLQERLKALKSVG